MVAFAHTLRLDNTHVGLASITMRDIRIEISKNHVRKQFFFYLFLIENLSLISLISKNFPFYKYM